MTKEVRCECIKWIYQFEQPEQCCNRCVEGTHRYVIGAFKKYPPAPDKVLICIGLNPNDGIPGRLEKTVQAINDFAFDNKRKIMKQKNNETKNELPSWPLDGWIMLNLSPIRHPDPNKLPTMLDEMNLTANNENIEIIKSILERYPDAVRLAAWGTGITKKSYLKETFYEFIEEEKRKKRKWYCCCLPSDRNKELDKKQKELKNIEAGLTQKGHPRHPSRNWGDHIEEAELHKFEISSYLTKLK